MTPSPKPRPYRQAAQPRPVRQIGRMGMQVTVKHPDDVVLTSRGFVRAGDVRETIVRESL